jgi:hypothetical protein
MANTNMVQAAILTSLARNLPSGAKKKQIKYSPPQCFKTSYAFPKYADFTETKGQIVFLSKISYCCAPSCNSEVAIYFMECTPLIY